MFDTIFGAIDGFYSTFLLSEHQTRDNIIGLVLTVLIGAWLWWGLKRLMSSRSPTEADAVRFTRFCSTLIIAIVATILICINYNLLAGAFTFMVISIIAACLLNPAAFELWGQPELELTEDQIISD